MDREEDEQQEDEEENEKEHPKQSSKAAALDKAVEDAEVLSDLGTNESKEQAAKRVLKMIKVIKDAKKTTGEAGQEVLQPALTELD